MKKFVLLMVGLFGLSLAAQAQVLVYRGTANGRLKGNGESTRTHDNMYLVRDVNAGKAALVSWWTTGAGRHTMKWQTCVMFANSGTTEQGLFRSPGSNEVQFEERTIPGGRTKCEGVLWWRDLITGGTRTGLAMVAGTQFRFRGTGFILGNQTQWAVDTAKVLKGKAIFRLLFGGGVKSGILDLNLRLDGPTTRRCNRPAKVPIDPAGDFDKSVTLLIQRLTNKGWTSI